MTRYRRVDTSRREFSTIFHLSGDPLFLIHLVLQRADDDLLPAMDPSLIIPPALRSHLPNDVIARYRTLSYHPRFSELEFPEVKGYSDIPASKLSLVQRTILREHRKFLERV